MTLDNMRRDFVNLQDRCRATIVRKINKRGDLEKLKVPPRIRAYLYEGMNDPLLPVLPGNKQATNLISSI